MAIYCKKQQVSKNRPTQGYVDNYKLPITTSHFMYLKSVFRF